MHILSAQAFLFTKLMYIYSNSSKSLSCLKSRAFTILELLVVITIISFLAAISVPSFQNYINFLRLKAMRNDIVNDINYLISASQKYGGNCNIQFNQLGASTQIGNRFAASLKCYQDSSQLPINVNLIPVESNNIFILSNSPSLAVGNHGAIVGPQDYIFVIGFHSSYRSNYTPLCFTLARYNSSIKYGKFFGNTLSLQASQLIKVDQSLTPSNCT